MRATLANDPRKHSSPMLFSSDNVIEAFAIIPGFPGGGTPFVLVIQHFLAGGFLSPGLAHGAVTINVAMRAIRKAGHKVGLTTGSKPTSDGPRRSVTPELNPVENVWAYLRANRLAISVFETYEDIVARCCDAWNFFANDIAAVRSITTREYAKPVKG